MDECFSAASSIRLLRLNTTVTGQFYQMESARMSYGGGSASRSSTEDLRFWTKNQSNASSLMRVMMQLVVRLGVTGFTFTGQCGKTSAL